jgi:hypothetical protein
MIDFGRKDPIFDFLFSAIPGGSLPLRTMILLTDKTQCTSWRQAVKEDFFVALASFTFLLHQECLGVKAPIFPQRFSQRTLRNLKPFKLIRTISSSSIRSVTGYEPCNPCK